LCRAGLSVAAGTARQRHNQPALPWNISSLSAGEIRRSTTSARSGCASVITYVCPTNFPARDLASGVVEHDAAESRGIQPSAMFASCAFTRVSSGFSQPGAAVPAGRGGWNRTRRIRRCSNTVSM
jgi:hypothetical protein